MAIKRTVWVGNIPDIFGYGICVAEDSEEACIKALKRAYNNCKKHRPDLSTNFKTSFENWGGRVTEVEFGKDYFDNFGE